jgi:hypothetical protein
MESPTIVVNVNIDTQGKDPKVEVKKNDAGKKSEGGVIQFPPMTSTNNPILDILGIKET